ncbi:MAG: type IV pilus secretin PilQ [Nitrospira sp.]
MKTLVAAAGASFRRAWWLGMVGALLSAQNIQAEPVPTQAASFEERVHDQARIASDAIDAPAQMVTKIEVRPEGDEVTVLVKGDGKLFSAARLLDENRLVVDLISVSSALKSPLVLGQHQLLRKVRVGYHADKVRLVLELLGRPSFSVTPVGHDILVSLKPRAVGPNAVPMNVASSTVGSITDSVGIGGSEFADPGQMVPRETRAKKGQVMGPAQGKFKVRTIQMATESATPESDSRGDDLVAGQTRFAGRRISLDFQQADITNILRLIAEVSGFNIVVGEGVKAKVTMKLVSVPWDQALDMLLKMNGLGMIRQGTIVWVDTLTNIAKQQDEEARAKEAKTKAEELVDRVFYIRNIQAQELQISLKQYLSPRGVMNISAGSNALIVRDTESKLAVLKQLVDGLDLQVPQVQIEARIVQADTVYARGLGIQWGIKDSSFQGNDFKFAGNATGAFAPVAGTGGTTIPRDFIVNLPAQVGGLPSVPAIGYQFGKLGPGFALDLRLSAGELLGLSKVIAAPKITTLDKREAKISQGESIPFQTTSLQGTQTTFVDANLELNVTPQITSRDPKEVGKQILMKVRATRNAVGARSNPAGPSIDRREATTQVIVRDGETMVIGGVFVDTQNNNVQGVPYLSRIPVLGWLFKNKSESVSKQELLIFMTPTIIRTT